MEYPYNDKYMIFDEVEGQYRLTRECLVERLGVDMLGAMNERNGINPSAMIDIFLRLVSDAVYNYIYKYSADNERQRQIIAKVPSARKMIQKAMEYQYLYMRLNGVFLLSPDQVKQERAISPYCVDTVMQVLPEINRSVCYTGV